MKRLNENSISPMVNRGDFTRGIPFYGTKGDFNFTAGRSKFTPGISIKLVPLIDMSVNGDPGFTKLDRLVAKLRHYFKPGDRIRGLVINSQLTSENGHIAVGKLYKIRPDYSNDHVRVWIKDPRTLNVKEVYVDSIERIYESSNRALSFSQFLGS